MNRLIALALTTTTLMALGCSKESKDGAGAPQPAPAAQPPADGTAPADAPPAAGVQAPASNAMPTLAPGDTTPLVQASNALALDLYAKQAATPGNMVFSPASISLAFGMTVAGANGDTAAEMAKVLHHPDGSDLHAAAAGLLSSWNKEGAPYQLSVVNRLFGEQSYDFEQPFLDEIKAAYGAPLEAVDFKTAFAAQRTHINKWVEDQTGERIKDLLPDGSLNELTALVLVNAVYFLSDWEKGFEAKRTRDESFAVHGSEDAKVPMMRQEETFSYAEVDGAKLIELDYKDSKLSMDILLPTNKDGLAALEAKLTGDTLDEWLTKLSNAGTKKVDLKLPRFELDDVSLPLKDHLMALGMNLAFDAEKADFTKMANPANPADQLYITNAFHKAFIKVDEKGTEAAAATAVVMGRKGAAPVQDSPKTFHADHPFIFAIRDRESGAILFMGRVVDPR